MKSKFNIDDYPAIETSSNGPGFNIDDYPAIEDKSWERILRSKDDQKKSQSFRDNNPIMSKVTDAAAKGLVWGGQQLKKHPKLSSYLEEFGNEADPYIESLKPASDFARKFGQNLGNSAISVANAPAGIIDRFTGQNTKTPHLNFDDFQTDSPYAGAAGTAGGLAADLLPINKISKGLDALGRPKGYAGLLSDIFKGAGAGYLMGEDEEGDRGLGTLIGGILKPALGLTNSAISSKVAGDAKKIETIANKKYGDIWNKTYSEGQGQIFKPRVKIYANGIASKPKMNSAQKKALNYSELEGGIQDKFLKGVRRYLRTGDIKDADKARSDIGKGIKNLENMSSRSSSQNRAIKYAEKAKAKIDSDINKNLRKAGGNDLVNELGNTRNWYAKDASKYLEDKNIKQFRGKVKNKALTEEGFVDRLKNNQNFQKELGKDYPEIGINNVIGKTLKWGSIPTALSGAFFGKDALRDMWEKH